MRGLQHTWGSGFPRLKATRPKSSYHRPKAAQVASTSSGSGVKPDLVGIKVQIRARLARSFHQLWPRSQVSNLPQTQEFYQTGQMALAGSSSPGKARVLGDCRAPGPAGSARTAAGAHRLSAAPRPLLGGFGGP